jgi:hypothetical protein
MFDFWGNEIPRYYQLETLASGTEHMLRMADTFVMPTVREVLKPAPVFRLEFRLFQEGRYQLIFRLHANGGRGNKATFAFVVAKNHEEASDVARGEHHHLRLLFERAPRAVVQPFHGGHVILPDHRKRQEGPRRVYAYLTKWLEDYHELGVNEQGQFILNIPNRHTFTIAQTEDLKAQAVAMVLRSFHPRSRDCMAMPEIASGDLVATHPDEGPVKLKLIACRKLLTKMTPARVLHELLSGSWPWARITVRLIPADPELLRRTMDKVLGEPETLRWLKQYQDAVAKRQLPKVLPEYVAELLAGE